MLLIASILGVIESWIAALGDVSEIISMNFNASLLFGFKGSHR